MLSIIGIGRVGSAIGFLIASTSLDDIVLVNRTKNKALGETLDIVNTIRDSSITVTGTDDFAHIAGSDVIIITASAGQIITSREDLLPYNIPIAKEISKKIKKYANNSKVVVVTNPVDVITYCILKESGLPRENVIGVGSSLDSSRFRYLLSKLLRTNQSKIDGMVLGEHGNSMVPIFSTARFNGKLINLEKNQIDQITSELRNYWKPMTEFKGASVFGAAKHSYDIAKAIINNEKLKVSSSVLVNGEFGVSDVCMGVPVIIDKNGTSKIEEINLDKSELESLNISAEIIKNNIKKI
ncbi:lactate dehydrogenase [Candidatus Pacearchaeota archaeon]|nr:lactate dehydrogenase [Candidatus Pacearchaeota archaeon]